MDTDDDVSALEEEEVGIWDPSPAPSLGLRQSPSSSPDSDSSLEISSSSDEEENSSPTIGSETSPFAVQECKEEYKNVVRYVIQSARTHTTEKEKYVLYCVEVRRFTVLKKGLPPADTLGYSNHKTRHKKYASFERRYSEFHAVYNALMESHRSLMEEFDGFPKKVIIGNFSQEVIAERCKGLARFMNFVHEQEVLRRTAVFTKFLHESEVKISDHYLLLSQFEEACPVIENTFLLFYILHWDTGSLICKLCQLIVCFHALGNYEKSYKYAQIALRKFEMLGSNKICNDLYMPLLCFCNSLWRILGKDRTTIKTKIEQERKERKEEGVPNLLDILRDEITVRYLH